MERNEFLDRLLGRRLTRREFGRALAAAGLGLAALPLRPSAARAAARLSYFTWSGYDLPQQHQKFIDKYGSSPDMPLFASEDEALQKLQAGFNVDLMHPCSYRVKHWMNAGILQPIDASRIPNYVDVWDRFKTIDNTSFDGKLHFVPWDCGNASILYRTDLVDPADVAPESWGLLFNEKYAGKLSMYDTDTTFVEIAARVLGYDNLYTLSDEQLAAIKPMLVKQRKIMPFYWSDATQIEQALAAGELVAAYAWNSSVTALKKEGLPVKYMNPKEGILTWVCGMVRHKNPPGDEQAAYDFIDAMLEPEVGKYMITEVGYGHSNRKSYELVDSAVLDELGMSNPETTFATADISAEAEEPYRSKYIELVNNVKAGID